MPFSIQDYEAFDKFARDRIVLHPPKSLDDLVEQWKQEREFEETVADIEEGLRDIEEGRTRPAKEAMRDIRERFAREAAEKEIEETIAAINQGVKEFEDGKALPVDEAFAEIRKELGWPAKDIIRRDESSHL